MSKTHFEYLEELIPNLSTLRILDIGSGRGAFLIDATTHGAKACGVELNPEYIQIAQTKARERNFPALDIRLGQAEKLPFDSESFEFSNVSEVLEHVLDPQQLLSELHRVLCAKGQAYVSVPNRWGFYDPHYHLYGINWLPRSVAATIIRLLGKSKEGQTQAGLQALEQMHYFSFGKICGLLEHQFKFNVRDIREIRLKKMFPSALMQKPVLLLYWLLRLFYFNTFHLLLQKKD